MRHGDILCTTQHRLGPLLCHLAVRQETPVRQPREAVPSRSWRECTVPTTTAWRSQRLVSGDGTSPPDPPMRDTGCRWHSRL
jgi:hypothetical protein